MKLIASLVPSEINSCHEDGIREEIDITFQAHSH